MDILKKGIKYLMAEKWYVIVGVIIAHMVSYLFRLSIYRNLKEFISGLDDVVVTGFNTSLLYYFVSLILVHLGCNLTYLFLEKQVVNKVSKLFKDIVNRMMFYHVDFFKKNNSNKISQLWFYLSSVETLLEKIILELPRITVFLLYYTYTLYSFSFYATMIILPVNILVLYLLHPLSRRQYKYQQQRTDLDLDTKNKLLETTSNIEFVKLNNRQSEEATDINKIYDNYSSLKYKDKRITTTLSVITEIFTDFLIMIIYSIGFTYIAAGGMKPIELLYLAAHTSNFYFQMLQLKEIYNTYKRISPKLHIIYDMLTYDVIENVVAKEKDFGKLEDNHDIIFHKITFGYDPSKLVIDDLSFRFKNSKINLLLGPNGCGKSTIIKLLLRLHDLEEGKMSNIIYYNGHNIKSFSLEELRKQITFVSQEPAIFNTTVWDNITYGNENVSLQHVREICALLDCSEWLATNKDKLCGFRGRDLSGGEKKKVQLLNAVCRDTDVIVFDEPSNALDVNAIKWFIEFVRGLRDNYKKTVIIITHDIRLKEVADNIVDLNN